MKMMILALFICLYLNIAYSQEKAILSVSADSGVVDVYVDTSFVGTTPIDSYAIDSGNHTLRFVDSKSLNWYHAPVIETIRIAPGEHIKRNVRIPSTGFTPHTIPSPWQAIMIGDSLGKIPATALEGKVVPNNLPLYLTTAGAIIGGGVAAYFKIQADKEYDDYQYTGDQASLDRVKRYDTISGIALAACEINLAALTYFLLSR